MSYPINVGFRFFVLALLASVVFPLLSQITAQQATLHTALVMVLAAWMMAFLFLKGPAIAAGILSGVPSLSAGQVIQAAAGTVAAGGAAITLGGAVAATGARGLAGVASLAARRPIALPASLRAAPSVRGALHHTLAQSSRYFSQDGAHGGTRADLS